MDHRGPGKAGHTPLCLRCSTETFAFAFHGATALEQQKPPKHNTQLCWHTAHSHTRGVHYFRYTRNLLKLGACLTVRLRSLKKNQLPLQGTGPKHTEQSIPCSPRWRARGTTASPTSFPKPRGTRKSSSFLASS